VGIGKSRGSGPFVVDLPWFIIPPLHNYHWRGIDTPLVSVVLSRLFPQRKAVLPKLSILGREPVFFNGPRGWGQIGCFYSPVGVGPAPRMPCNGKKFMPIDNFRANDFSPNLSRPSLWGTQKQGSSSGAHHLPRSPTAAQPTDPPNSRPPVEQRHRKQVGVACFPVLELYSFFNRDSPSTGVPLLADQPCPGCFPVVVCVR